MTRDFRAYLAAEITSEFGSMFTATATGVLAVNAFDATPGQVGVVVATAFVPGLVFGLAAGVAADRVRRPRRVLIVCDAIAATAVGGLALGLWSGLASIWWLAALNLVLGTVGVLVAPVYFTHLSALVGAREVVHSRAKLQTGQYAARLSGRTLAGPVIAFVAPFGLVVDALSYVTSLTLLSSIRTPDVGTVREAPDAPRVSAVGEVVAGMRELWRTPFLRSLSTFLFVVSAATGAGAALTAPFLLRTLHLPVVLFSLLFAITGVAGLAGSLLATRLVSRISSPALAVLGFGSAAVSLLVLPAAAGSLPVTVTVAAFGTALPILGGAIANVGLAGVVTADIPEPFLGRVTATLQTALTVAQLVGALGGGVLGSRIGVRGGLFACALVSVAGLLIMVPSIRNLQRTTTTEIDKAPELVAPAVDA